MKQPIKIVRIITRLNIGGPAIHATLLSEELNSVGDQPVENTLIHGAIEGDEGNMDYLLNRDRVRTIFIPQLKQRIRPFSDLIAFFKIFYHLKKIRPTIVHTHLAKAGFLGRLAAWILRVPIIVHTYHGHTFHHYFSKWFEKFQKTLEKFLNKRSQAVVALSSELKRELTEQYKIVPPVRCKIIPLGFHLDKFRYVANNRESSRKKLGLPVGKILIGTIGRMVPIKNQLLFLKSVQLLKEDHKKRVHLLFVGEGAEKEKLVSYVKEKGMEDSVTFFNWQREMLPFYQALNYFVLPSLNEGTPVTIIEAMASGIPILASRVGGIPDLLGKVEKEMGHKVSLAERGILFLPEEASLGAALDYCLDHPQIFDPILPRAKESIFDTFSSRKLIFNISSLYLSLLRERKIS